MRPASSRSAGLHVLRPEGLWNPGVRFLPGRSQQDAGPGKARSLVLADARLPTEGPAGIGGHPEDVLGLVFVRVFGIGPA
jgi:hypothetical protein